MSKPSVSDIEAVAGRIVDRMKRMNAQLACGKEKLSTGTIELIVAVSEEIAWLELSNRELVAFGRPAIR